jgi:hypothetical protein
VDDDEWLAHVEAGLRPSQQAFLTAWHQRTHTWPYDALGDVRPVDEHDGDLVVFADLVDTTRNSSMLTIAAHFDGTTVRCDRVHNQLFCLPATPTAEALIATGSPEELADRAADWFEAVLRRRVVCHEWHQRRGRVVARNWLFADTGELLAGQGPRQSRPPDSKYDARTEWS